MRAKMLCCSASTVKARPAYPATETLVLANCAQVSPNFHKFELDQGTISMWVKMASKWCSEAIYIWTVIAPAIFPGRDFGYG